MRGKCAKQETIAVIENDGQYWIGSNWCGNAQEICPRSDMPTGEGYAICKNVCKQVCHAEVDALQNAGLKNTKGGKIYLIGHTYCCESCKNKIKEYGITEVIIGRMPWEKV
jgi:deoxycytidylate deaminase